MTVTRKPLTDAHSTAWARLVRTSQSTLQRVETALKEAELPPLSWYDLLLELNRAGPAGLRPFQLQAEMLLQQYNMSRLIDRVANAGLVERLECGEDGRGQIIRISTAGKNLQKKMWLVYRRVLEERISKRLSETQAAILGELLAQLEH